MSRAPETQQDVPSRYNLNCWCPVARAICKLGETRSLAAPPSRRCLVDDVIATVDVQRFTGDKAGRVVRQEGRGRSHVLDADQAARRRLCLRLVEQFVEFG